MFTPGLAIFFLAMILKPDHVCVAYNGHAGGGRASQVQTDQRTPPPSSASRQLSLSGIISFKRVLQDLELIVVHCSERVQNLNVVYSRVEALKILQSRR